MFHLCYLDESGCLGALPSAASQVQPVFALVGLIVPASRLERMTREFMNLKRRFNPGLFSGDAHDLDAILREVKGASLRKDLRSANRNRRRAALGFLDGALDLLERTGVRLVGRVWVKPVGGPFKGREIYTSSAQAVAENFHRFLADRRARGIMVCDSRFAQANTQVAHSVFTRKVKFPAAARTNFFFRNLARIGRGCAIILPGRRKRPRFPPLRTSALTGGLCEQSGFRNFFAALRKAPRGG